MRRPKIRGVLNALAVGIVIVVMSLAFRYQSAPKDSASLEAAGALTLQENRPSTFLESDSDNDGLKDWEETLWKTDPENSDTDGDGTLDGEEISLGRDPKIPGPDDIFSAEEVGDIFVPTGEPKDPSELNYTEKFSRAFITTYLDTKTSGVSFSGQAELLSNLAIPQLPRVLLHSASELTIDGNTDNASVHDYGNAVGRVLLSNGPGVENELILMFNILRENDQQSVKDLLKITTSYRANAQDLLSVTVPQDAASKHIDLINAFLVIARNIESMAQLYDDPLMSLAGFDEYFNSADALIGALNALGSYLENSTTFTPQEGGYIFTSNL